MRREPEGRTNETHSARPTRQLLQSSGLAWHGAALQVCVLAGCSLFVAGRPAMCRVCAMCQACQGRVGPALLVLAGKIKTSSLAAL